MSIFDNPDQLRLLQNLLYPTERRDFDASSDSDEDTKVPPQAHNKLTPGSIGPQGDDARSKAGGAKSNKKHNTVATPLKPCDGGDGQKQPKCIEEWQKLQEEQDAELLETRKCPEYTMHYRQAVGTEDVFLQMGNRTGATASCEDMILEIKLPEETVPAEKMHLSIKSQEIELSSPVYRLKLPLVHAVNVDRCRAEYDPEVRKLSLILRLERELDFVNF